MAYTPKILYPTGYPTVAGSTLYTVPGSTSAIIKNIVLTNTTSNDAEVTIHVIQPGGSAQQANRILSNYNVPASGVSTLDCSIVMPSGGYLFAHNYTNDAISVTVSGVEIT